jgi:hypothetical protein
MRNAWLAVIPALLIIASVRAAIAQEDDEAAAGSPPQSVSRPNKWQIERPSGSSGTSTRGISPTPEGAGRKGDAGGTAGTSTGPTNPNSSVATGEAGPQP